MTTSSRPGPREGGAPGHEAERRMEQGYADWAYGLLEGKLEAVANRPNVAGDAATYRALNKDRERQASHLRGALADPAGLLIGRLDMVDDETWYIGRHGVDGPGGDPAVVDWRADLAEKFFRADRTFSGGVGRRRTIRMKARRVTELSDETLVPGFTAKAAAPVVHEPPIPIRRRQPELERVERQTAWEMPPVPVAAPVEPSGQSENDEMTEPADDPGLLDSVEVRARDLLLDDLARERTGVMADIVATIQADQDRLVRAAPDIPLVIQGGPGTGKTVVGLHRAAWVLYRQRGTMAEQSVLVVGPNQAFLEYISSVLPSLGEDKVRQTTVDDLALDGVSSVDRRRLTMVTEEPKAVARIKGDARMAAVVEAAVWSAARPGPVRLGFERSMLHLDADQVAGLIEALRRRGTPYSDARRGLEESVTNALAEQYVERHRGKHFQVAGSTFQQLALAARAQLSRSGVFGKMLPILEPRKVIEHLLEDAEVLECAGTALTTKERALLVRPISHGRHRWTAADLPLVDEAAACIRGRGAVFGHVVVDEAQDLSPMKWRVIRRRTQRGSMTILGDLAQATSEWTPRSWSDVLAHLDLSERAEVAELRLGYRVPQQVMAFASPLVERAAPTVCVPKSFRSTLEPMVRRFPSHDLARVALEVVGQQQGNGALAVIAPADHQATLESALSAAPEVTVLTPEEAKGLEFNVVIVVEPAAIAGRSLAGLRSLYICFTRATQQLVVLHSKPLPEMLHLGTAGRTPTTFSNPGDDDPWDNDAAHWLLTQSGGKTWTLGVLFECLRQQPNRLRRDPQRVKAAAQLAKRHGVVQERHRHGSRTIVRLYRTDPDAPSYPLNEADRRRRRSATVSRASTP